MLAVQISFRLGSFNLECILKTVPFADRCGAVYMIDVSVRVSAVRTALIPSARGYVCAASASTVAP